MTLQEMVYAIRGSFGNRFQANQKEILTKLDAAQKAAFNHDCRAFEKTAELRRHALDLSNFNVLGTIKETRAKVEASWGTESTNELLTLAGLNYTSGIVPGDALLTSDMFAYYMYSNSVSGPRWREIVKTLENVLLFPSDCRAIKEVFADDIEVDAFARRITTSVSRDALQVSYYRQPETLTYESEDKYGFLTFSQSDEAKIIIPAEWRWQILVQPATALLDSTLYGDKSPQAYIESYFKEFWEAMNARRNDRKTLTSVGAWL